jgi:hypothetical protein
VSGSREESYISALLYKVFSHAVLLTRPASMYVTVADVPPVAASWTWENVPLTTVLYSWVSVAFVV